MSIRQPIIVVMGHVDHGKTSLLDAIRKTAVALSEPGAITQSISASHVPIDVIKKICGPALRLVKTELKIPGLLFVDTPGHEAFTNLRKRGGSIADIAILVVDIMQGFQPQTLESIEILREYKTPFIVVANKIDLITGWKSKEGCFIDAVAGQRQEVQQALDEKIYEIVGKLSEHGFNSERFDRVKDFTREIAIVPICARTGEGIPELLILLAGLSQKYLEQQLHTEDRPGRGSILETKYEKGLGTTIDTILYDGVLHKGDIIILATKKGVLSTRVRGLIIPGPGGELRYVDEVRAATGVKIFAPGLEDALPGSEVYVAVKPDEEENYRKHLESELKNILISTERIGVILKADSLGSIEAISRLLQAEGVQIRRADVGAITKQELNEANAIRSKDRYAGAILAFNVHVDFGTIDDAKSKSVPVIQSNVIYSLIERFKEWRKEEKEREKQEALASIIFPAKIRVLPGFCFRASKPAIFGIEVTAGRIKPNYELMKEDGTVIGRIKSIQAEKQPLQEAVKGQQVAVSVDEAAYGRDFSDGEYLYTAVPKKDVDIILEKYKSQLTDEELSILEKIQRMQIGLLTEK
ncbi:MAG: translation initiation factor IF-2 [Candidatus Micrarchaeia archaeon]